MPTVPQPRTGCDSRTCPGRLGSKAAALESSRHEESAGTGMSAEDLEQYESELELQLYREYKDVVGIFTYAVETERRFFPSHAVDPKVRTQGGDVYHQGSIGGARAWAMYRRARFVKSAKVLTFRDVSIEEIAHSDLQVPKSVTGQE